MDVRRAACIRHRSDRQKAIAAGLVGDHLAEALKILVARPPAIAITDIVIAAIGVALPDLDARSAHRPPAAVENTARDAGHGALRRLGMPRDMREIIVGIGRVIQGIERPFCLLRGWRKPSSGGPQHRGEAQRGRAGDRRCEDAAARQKQAIHVLGPIPLDEIPIRFDSETGFVREMQMAVT